MNNRCEHCGGAMAWDHEHPTDAPVWKCLVCSRVAGAPRPHEEPTLEPWGPGSRHSQSISAALKAARQ